ncbi:MAG: response regulator [Candidatus Zhuqueibacterota bacterium]
MGTCLNILHLEDDPIDTEIVQEALKAENPFCEILRVDTRDDFVAALEARTFDLILADYSLPMFDGLSALSYVKEHYPEIPFILISGTLGEELAIDSLKLGATDYVIKQRLSRLVPSVKRALKEVDDRNERRRTEAQLARLASVVEQASESIVIVDLNGDIEYVNPNFERLTGYTAAEVLGKNPKILKSGAQPESYYRDLWQTISSGKTWFGIFQNKRKDGVLFFEDAVIFPIKNQQGVIINYAAVKRDITSEKLLEEQLLQSQKLEAIGQLAGGIAHDFNNILTAIMGYSEVALMNLNSNDQVYWDVKAIIKAGQKASNLTRQLLTFSRKQIIQPKIIDINRLITDLEKLLYRLISEDIKLKMALSDKIGRIHADPGQIEQVLINLVVNARDAVNHPSIAVTRRNITIETRDVMVDDASLLTHTDMAPGRYLLLSVSDTGIGMIDEIKRKIFEPFFTTKKISQGTGLGLSTVYGIVKQNNATILVDSQVDRGSTFTIYWPCAESAEPLYDTPEEETPLVGGNERILFVEDDDRVRAFSVKALKSLGYEVIPARDGADALRIVRRKKITFDLLITDVVMPEMGGIELAEKLSADRDGFKVLFTSGYLDRDYTDHDILKEEINFIQKPYRIHSMAKKIREVLLR